MEYTKEHIKAQIERIVELEQQRDAAQELSQGLNQELARNKRFISVLSWELDLPNVSHSTEQDYIDAIRVLRKQAVDIPSDWDKARLELRDLRVERDGLQREVVSLTQDKADRDTTIGRINWIIESMFRLTFSKRTHQAYVDVVRDIRNCIIDATIPKVK